MEACRDFVEEGAMILRACRMEVCGTATFYLSP